jgi:cytidine deaminase
MDFDTLYEKAKMVLIPKRLTKSTKTGDVAAAILTQRGNVYVGVSVETACSIGFCAEHSAAAAMITSGENVITKVIAVHSDGRIIPPCGRCREFLIQLADDNEKAAVKVDHFSIVTLRDLLPYDWRKK